MKILDEVEGRMHYLPDAQRATSVRFGKLDRAFVVQMTISQYRNHTRFVLRN
jgi:hypothetical protein